MPRLVKLSIQPNTTGMVVPSDIAVDMPDIYEDLRTGLAGSELKRVEYEQEVGGVMFVTTAWFDQQVSPPYSDCPELGRQYLRTLPCVVSC